MIFIFIHEPFRGYRKIKLDIFLTDSPLILKFKYVAYKLPLSSGVGEMPSVVSCTKSSSPKYIEFFSTLFIYLFLPLSFTGSDTGLK